MGLSEPVQKPAEAEQIDLRNFGRPPIDQVPTEKNLTPTATYAQSSPSGPPPSPAPGRVHRKKCGGGVAAGKDRPGGLHPLRDLKKG